MNKNQKAMVAEANQLVAEFNNQFPVGSTVMHRTMASKSTPFIERKVKGEAFAAHGNTAVAFFEGISGYCSIEPEFVQYAETNICYKTNEPCKYNCSGLCKESV